MWKSVSVASTSERTILSSLKTPTRGMDIEAGDAIYVNVVRMDLIPKDPFFCSKLINMYAKLGFLTKSFEVLDQMPIRDVVSWTAIIAGYVRCGHAEEALQCFQQMQLDDVIPDSVASVYALKACASTRHLGKGQQIHSQVRTRSLREDLLVCTSLIDMYAKCGSLTQAKQVFDEISMHDSISWTTLVVGYLDHGYNEEVLNSFERMRLIGMPSDGFTFVCSLKACGNVRAIRKGLEIHSQIQSNGFLEKDPVVGNALVCFYAKCGKMGTAQRVFDLIQERDVILWTTLIAGYLEQRCSDEAFNYIEQMRVEGILANDVTFICILQACSNIWTVDRGHKLHAQIEGMVLSEALSIGNVLIGMYAKFGQIMCSQKVLDNLRIRDVISWTTLITGYHDHQYCEEALTCFEEMQIEGICPNIHTLQCVLHACGNMGAIGKGLEIHTHMEKKGWVDDNDIAAATALVHMFIKCGLLPEAHRVFEFLKIRDLVLWTTLIGGFVEFGHNTEALESFERMQYEDISPDAVTFVYALKACSIIGAANEVIKIHVELERQGIFGRDIVVGTALVHTYFKCGILYKAQEVFERLPVRNVVTWTTAIAGFTEHGFIHEAFYYLEQMRLQGSSPNAVTFTHCLAACSSVGLIGKGREIHDEVEREGFLEKDLLIGKALVDMYGKLGVFGLAKGAFEKSLSDSVILWNSLISSYAEHGHGEEALRCFDKMMLNGVSPDAATLMCSLNACAKIQDIRAGIELHARVEGMDLLRSDIYIGCTLVDMYAKHSMLGKACDIFERMSVRNVFLWTVLIAGYVNVKEDLKALEYLELMKLEGVVPNSVTYVWGLKACSKLGAEQNILRIHSEIESKGLFEDVALGNVLIDAYAKSGFLAIAQSVFKMLPMRNIASWNSLLAGYIRHAKVEQFSHCFNRMLFDNLKSDASTFLLALTACNYVSQFSEHESYFDNLTKLFGIAPNTDHTVHKIKYLSHNGFLEKAILTLAEMPTLNNPVVWHALLSSCAYYGNLDLGICAFKKTTPHNEGYL